jgi:phosphatidylglycerophosphatase A
MRAPLPIRLLPDATVVNLATLWGLGNLRAPGTWGSVAGLLWFTVLSPQLGELGLLLMTGLLVPVAVWFCDEAEWRLQRHDPGCVILDEFIALPLCFVALTPVLQGGRTWLILLLGFLLFRLFDILKPPPIRQLQRLPGGLGVVVDDLAAALATCITLHLMVHFLPGWFWPA